MATLLTAPPAPPLVEAADHPKPETQHPPLLTVESGIYTLIVLSGLALRLVALGAAPLSPTEAAASWPAWLDAWAIQVDHAQQPASALLHALQLFTFWVSGGYADWSARLPVALVSALLPLLPWFWRERLGRVAALALALLLAIDPWLLALGRSANAALLSATLALVSLSALERARHGSVTALYVAAIAAGLLLVSGPQAWSWLAVLGLSLLLLRPHPWETDADATLEPASDDEAPVPRVSWRGPLVAGAAAALLGATGWLAQPQELAMVSASLGVWLGQVSGGPYSFGYPWLRLLVDQPFLLLFSGIGLLSLRSVPAGQGAARLFLLAWIGWGVLLLLLPGRAPETLPLLGVPLAVCAALGVQWFWTAARAVEDWREAGLLALVLGVILLSLLFWITGLIFAQNAPVTHALVAIAMLLVVALLLVGFAFFAGGRQALVVGLGVSGVVLLAASLSATWQLVFVHQPARPDGFFAAVGLPDSRALVEDVEALSFRRTGDATELPVQIVTGPELAPDPQVGWLLRSMRNVRFVPAPESSSSVLPGLEALVVTSSVAGAESWNAAYVGSEYRLRQSWLPASLTQESAGGDAPAWTVRGRPWLRWLLYRDAPAPEAASVVLWARP